MKINVDGFAYTVEEITDFINRCGAAEAVIKALTPKTYMGLKVVQDPLLAPNHFCITSSKGHHVSGYYNAASHNVKDVVVGLPPTHEIHCSREVLDNLERCNKFNATNYAGVCTCANFPDGGRITSYMCPTHGATCSNPFEAYVRDFKSYRELSERTFCDIDDNLAALPVTNDEPACVICGSLHPLQHTTDCPVVLLDSVFNLPVQR